MVTLTALVVTHHAAFTAPVLSADVAMLTASRSYDSLAVVRRGVVTVLKARRVLVHEMVIVAHAAAASVDPGAGRARDLVVVVADGGRALGRAASVWFAFVVVALACEVLTSGDVGLGTMMDVNVLLVVVPAVVAAVVTSRGVAAGAAAGTTDATAYAAAAAARAFVFGGVVRRAREVRER